MEKHSTYSTALSAESRPDISNTESNGLIGSCQPHLNTFATEQQPYGSVTVRHYTGQGTTHATVVFAYQMYEVILTCDDRGPMLNGIPIERVESVFGHKVVYASFPCIVGFSTPIKAPVQEKQIPDAPKAADKFKRRINVITPPTSPGQKPKPKLFKWYMNPLSRCREPGCLSLAEYGVSCGHKFFNLCRECRQDYTPSLFAWCPECEIPRHVFRRDHLIDTETGTHDNM